MDDRRYFGSLQVRDDEITRQNNLWTPEVSNETIAATLGSIPQVRQHLLFDSPRITDDGLWNLIVDQIPTMRSKKGDYL